MHEGLGAGQGDGVRAGHVQPDAPVLVVGHDFLCGLVAFWVMQWAGEKLIQKNTATEKEAGGAARSSIGGGRRGRRLVASSFAALSSERLVSSPLSAASMKKLPLPPARRAVNQGT